MPIAFAVANTSRAATVCARVRSIDKRIFIRDHACEFQSLTHSD